MSKLKILYLYSELVGYQMPIFEEYVDYFDAQVYVLYWDKDKLKPYEPKKIKNVTYYKRSEYSNTNLLNLANMEIILYSPNLYVHLHDAVLVVQLLISGFAEFAGQLKL